MEKISLSEILRRNRFSPIHPKNRERKLEKYVKDQSLIVAKSISEYFNSVSYERELDIISEIYYGGGDNFRDENVGLYARLKRGYRYFKLPDDVDLINCRLAVHQALNLPVKEKWGSFIPDTQLKFGFGYQEGFLFKDKEKMFRELATKYKL